MYKNNRWGKSDHRYRLRFNPCFNGSMYKNTEGKRAETTEKGVSILVLMDLCIKTLLYLFYFILIPSVSILVLMDLCIKTFFLWHFMVIAMGFNPCFNGSMYKNTFRCEGLNTISGFQSLF